MKKNLLAMITLMAMLGVSCSPTESARQAEDPGEPGVVARQVWEDAEAVFTHSPSPDGRFMTFVYWNRPAQFALSSRWSPDGKRIAYCWHYGAMLQLRILDVDDPKPRILFQDESPLVWVFPQDWSPDGQHILTRIYRGLAGIFYRGESVELAGVELALVPVEGGSPRVLKTFELEKEPNELHFSPDGRYVVYCRRPAKTEAYDIFILDLEGGDEIPLIQHHADDYVFGWSPDGNWILFLSDRSETRGLWAIRVAAGKPQGAPVILNPSIGRIAPLGFAKNGSFYYADIKLARDVYEARIDFETGKILASPERAINRYEGSNMNPRYSPDGKSLAYVSNRVSMVWEADQANALCIHSLESGSERVFKDEFASLDISILARPRWSPDSRLIAVAGQRQDGVQGLYIANLDTGKVTTLLEMPPGVGIDGHEFSSDNRRIFYIKRDNKEKISRILARDLLSGEERELYQTAGINSPLGIAASPDGKWLASITHPLALSIIPSSGGSPQVVHRFDQQTNISNPEWMSDGKTIIVSVRSSAEASGSILYRVPAEGGEPQKIMLQPELWDRPTIHPDGQRIAFGCIANHDIKADIWVLQDFLPEFVPTKSKPSRKRP
jgi:Tol biopolymer transport system component